MSSKPELMQQMLNIVVKNFESFRVFLPDIEQTPYVLVLLDYLRAEMPLSYDVVRLFRVQKADRVHQPPSWIFDQKFILNAFEQAVLGVTYG